MVDDTPALARLWACSIQPDRYVLIALDEGIHVRPGLRRGASWCPLLILAMQVLDPRVTRLQRTGVAGEPQMVMPNGVMLVAYSRNGMHMSHGRDDSTLPLWDAAGSKHLAALEGHILVVHVNRLVVC